MELFRTVVKCTASPEKIRYGVPFAMLGSCFAESVGLMLRRLKFNILLNPFGIVYHPSPAARGLKRAVSGQPYTAGELQLRGELWHSFDHHGRFSRPDVSDCLQLINAELQQARDELARSELLFVTFGTAWAYRLKSSGLVAANCHRFPASDFDRIRFDADEIFDLWADAIVALRRFNPAIKVVFTVSPIRHLRDGAHENQLSKAALLLAVDRLNREIEHTGYFPAYEIILDELRDYRFYSGDMTHPDGVAVNYVRQRFCESYMDEETLQTAKAADDVVKAAAHRPVHYNSEYRKFAADCLEKIAKLNRQHPQLDFSEEIKRFSQPPTA